MLTGELVRGTRRTAWLCACLVEAHRRGPRSSVTCWVPCWMFYVFIDLDSRRRPLMTKVILTVMKQGNIRTLSLAGHSWAPFVDSQADSRNAIWNHLGPRAVRSHLLESVRVSLSHLVTCELCRTRAALCVQSLSHVRRFATPWTVACQAPLSVGFSRRERWSGLPFPPPGDLPDPGTESVTYLSPALQEDSLLLSHQGSPIFSIVYIKKNTLFS